MVNQTPDQLLDFSNQPQDRSQQLEQFITQVCQTQPVLPAPLRLQARVIAEVQRRAARPWWHKSFVHWPITARILFVISSLGVAQLTLMVLARLHVQSYTTQLIHAVNEPVSRLQSMAKLLSLLDDSLTLVIEHIPAAWLYGGALSIATAYAALFGLGVAAYRALHINR